MKSVIEGVPKNLSVKDVDYDIQIRWEKSNPKGKHKNHQKKPLNKAF